MGIVQEYREAYKRLKVIERREWPKHSSRAADYFGFLADCPDAGRASDELGQIVNRAYAEGKAAELAEARDSVELELAAS